MTFIIFLKILIFFSMNLSTVGFSKIGSMFPLFEAFDNHFYMNWTIHGCISSSKLEVSIDNKFCSERWLMLKTLEF